MAIGFWVASAEAKRIATNNQDQCDHKVTCPNFKVGDRILVRKVEIQGKHKLGDKWDIELKIIQSKPNPELILCKVKSISGR